MRILITFLLTISMLILCGCEETKKDVSMAHRAASAPAENAQIQGQQPANVSPRSAVSAGLVTTIGGRETHVSLDEASAVQAATLAADRKIRGRSSMPKRDLIAELRKAS